MDVVRRFVDSARAELARLLSEWDETDVVASACCAPDHLLPSGGDATGKEAGDDECRCCGS